MKCDYCNKNEGKFKFKNGKICCEKNISKCPSIKDKLSDKLKIQYSEGTRISHFIEYNDGSNWKGRNHSEETKNKLSIINKGKKMSDEFKEDRQKEMNSRYERGWESTAGRTKKLNYNSPIAGKIKIDGNWELKVCEFLDKKNYNWSRNKKRFKYLDKNNKERTYCPDFYLIDKNVYIEVKGYKTELDEYKWKQFNNNLEIWNKDVLKEKNII